jgi:hypothetical protein
MARRSQIAPVGSWCAPEDRGGRQGIGHTILKADEDADLLAVFSWLHTTERRLALAEAVDSAVKYVLDGQRTRRFSLDAHDVDRDERASVGTKLQYHIIEGLGLKKAPPLDTHIDSIAVEIKGTVGESWMIPKEGQCQVTLMIKIDSAKQRFCCHLMRTHFAWLNAPNQDGKRTPRAEAVKQHAFVVLPWTSLPDEPLRRLSPAELDLVFSATLGLRTRYKHLFAALPGVVVPRGSMLVVGARSEDPLRRARESRWDLFEMGLDLLVGTWPEQRAAALSVGLDLGTSSWAAVPVGTRTGHQLLVPPGQSR